MSLRRFLSMLTITFCLASAAQAQTAPSAGSGQQVDPITLPPVTVTARDGVGNAAGATRQILISRDIPRRIDSTVC